MSVTQILRGKPETFVLNFDIDITGYTVVDMIKKKISDLDSAAIFTKTITTHSDAVNGVSGYVQTAAETNAIENGFYWHSTKLFDENGDAVSETFPDQLQYTQNLVQALTV